MDLIKGDQRSRPIRRGSISAVSVYLVLVAVLSSHLVASPALADDIVGAASENIVLDIYVDAGGRTLIVGYLEVEGPEDLAFLEGSEYIHDEETGELYALSDVLTSVREGLTTLEFEADANWNECHLAFYLPEDAEILSVSSSAGLEYSVTEAEDSMMVEALGYDLDGVEVVIDYDLA
jgi:hypothetical protein